MKFIEIYQSTSLDGYHLYVTINKELSFIEKMPYRKKWRDDGQRIVMDILKDDEKLKDVLFSYRMKKGKIINRIFIERVAWFFRYVFWWRVELTVMHNKRYDRKADNENERAWGFYV